MPLCLQPPSELWMLYNKEGTPVKSIDDAREGPTYLVALSESEAHAAAKHQNEMYDLDCVPVCVIRNGVVVTHPAIPDCSLEVQSTEA